MQDRVADVLREREALARGGAAAGVAGSIVLHAMIAAAFAYAAMHKPVTQRISPINIRFAPAAPAPAVSVPAPAPAVKKPEAPRIEKPMPAPVKAVTKAPPEKNTALPSPFGQSAKKASDNPETRAPKAAAPSSGSAVTDTVGVGQTGVTGLEGGEFPYTVYIDRMINVIGSHWARPQVAAGVVTIIHFEIERDGRIRMSEIETPSGQGLFDRAALRAVQETNRLPPLPFGYTGTYLGVHLTFR